MDPSLLSVLGNQGSGIQEDRVPQDLESLLDAVKNPNKQDKKAHTEEVVPIPSFVVKTVDQEKNKVFLNFCGSDRVPGWGMDDKQVKEALKEYGKDTLSDDQMEALRVPISVGEMCPDIDKKGDPCLVVDCIFNLDIAKQAKAVRNLKIFLIDIVFEWVEQKHKVELDRKYKLPRLKYKGDEIRSQRIRVDKKPVVQDVKEIPDDPCFPLLSEKAKQKEHVTSTFINTTNAASGVQSKMKTIKYEVSFEGKPAHSAIITVSIPPSHITKGEDVIVEVCGFNTWVNIAGCAPLCISLPFCVSNESAEVKLLSDEHKLVIKLSHRPISSLLSEMRCKSPHNFGSLDLNPDLCLELEGA